MSIRVHKAEGVHLTFDTPESVGEIKVERCGFGAYISVNGKCLALIDLYHLSPSSDEKGDGPGFPQVVIYTGNDGDDSAAHIRWLEDEVRFLFNGEERHGVDANGETYTVLPITPRDE